MKLRTFSAPSIADAMRMVRAELGPDAIILSSQRANRREGVLVTAATEAAPPSAGELAPAAQSAIDAVDALGEILEFHGLTPLSADRLLAAAADAVGGDSMSTLAGGLAARYGFAPIDPAAEKRPLMLVGSPGAGKTSTLAKLAARARLAKQPVAAVTCDMLRAGAVEQLATYTRLLQIPAYRAADAATLARAAQGCADGTLLLVDTMGSNPFDGGEMRSLAELAQAIACEPVLVLAAGGDPAESGEIAAAFCELGCRRIIATRTDTARRLGGVLAAAESGGLSLADFGVSPQIAQGLRPASAVGLAQRLVGATQARPSRLPQATSVA